MPDVLSPEQRSRNMASIRSQGNATTEHAFLKLLHSERITGWRRHVPLPGKPDFVFHVGRLAVFVDGCFWHGCPSCYRPPRRNRKYWKDKVTRNRLRDRLVSGELRRRGWRVLRIWEHSLKDAAQHGRLVRRLRRALLLRPPK